MSSAAAEASASSNPRHCQKGLIREILDEARWSPSWANTQAWRIYAVNGETLERLRNAGEEPNQREAPAGPDFRMPREWPPHLAARATYGPAEFYGAPCVLFFAAERGLASDYVLFDNGLLAQSVCLAAHDRGLGSCIMAMAVRDPDALRELLPGAADKQFVIAVALGYPDEEAPVNNFERSRAPLEELVTWAE